MQDMKGILGYLELSVTIFNFKDGLGFVFQGVDIFSKVPQIQGRPIFHELQL